MVVKAALAVAKAVTGSINNLHDCPSGQKMTPHGFD
tara:strand:- start:6884 stop:6991 length:108 start_codon:yes stop_codon:yes gene_type:complete